jgi:hypothetical protein
MSKTSELEQAVSLALNLSPLDKVRLVEQIMATLEQELSPKTPKQSLYGLWSDVKISDDELDEAREELWGNIPREDI